MNLSSLCIQRPVMTSLLMGSLLFFGLASYFYLPVSDLPSVDMPTIQVSVSYPGASAETMAQAVATPLEQQFMTLEDIQTVFSSSEVGSSSIILQFSLDRDIDAASTDVQAAISVAQPNLPSDLPNAPTYQKVNPASTPILYLTLSSSSMTAGDLYDYAHTFIGQRLSMVEGVSRIITYGSPYAVRIQVDPEKLAARGIGIDEVVQTIQSQNVELPLGSLWGAKESFTLQADGQLKKGEEYGQIVVKQKGGQLVKIRDLGRSLDSVADDKFSMFYVNRDGGKSCVVLAVQKLSGGNTVAVIDRINQILEELKEDLPASVEMERMYDQSLSIREGIHEVEMTLLLALCLVVLIVYILLGRWLYTLIPSLAIPLSMLGTFAIMDWMGYSVDLLSLLALTLAIGFLVDDAIVVLENSVRHAQEGLTPFQAALTSASQVLPTVLSMTLSLASVLIPMLFMQGVMGKLFSEFAWTLLIAILFSGFISLTLTPMLTSRWIGSGMKEGKMELLAQHLNEGMRKGYIPLLSFALRHRALVLFVALGTSLGSWFLFQTLPMDFLPPDDVGFIQGFSEARQGTSPYLMKQYHETLCDIAIEDPSVESILSVSSYATPSAGFFFFKLLPYGKRPPMDQVIERLSQKLHQAAGVNAFLSPLPLINLTVGTTSQALYQYVLSSPSLETLCQTAPHFLDTLQRDPSFSQVSSDLKVLQPIWSLSIDRDKASFYGVDAKSLETFLSQAYSENRISQINQQINQYDVIVETLPYFDRSPEVLSSLYVRSQNEALVPLSEVVTSQETVGPLTVNHLDGLPVAGISFNPGGKTPLGLLVKKLDAYKETLLPPSVKGKLVGTADIFQTSFESLPFLLLLSFFTMYVILGILYESFIHPITVMSSVPAALFGGLLTLHLFGESLSIYSFVGLILLLGIVLKNGIILVDFANEKVEKEKKGAQEAMFEAAQIRFRPIMMTTLSSLFGALPIALGFGGSLAQSRISLGLAIVGGLMVSQLLTLLVTPVLYCCLESLQRRWFKRS